jgi:hypothetical protein
MEQRAGMDQTWKMRFLRRRALVCEAKLGGLDAPPAAPLPAAEGSITRQQFLGFFLFPLTELLAWKSKRQESLLVKPLSE